MERVFFCPVHPSVYQWSIVADQAAEHTTATFRPPELFDVKTGISLDERVDIWVRRFPTPFFFVCVCVWFLLLLTFSSPLVANVGSTRGWAASFTRLPFTRAPLTASWTAARLRLRWLPDGYATFYLFFYVWNGSLVGLFWSVLFSLHPRTPPSPHPNHRVFACSGQVEYPEENPYSDDFCALIDFMLDPEIENRPFIADVIDRARTILRQRLA